MAYNNHFILHLILRVRNFGRTLLGNSSLIHVISSGAGGAGGPPFKMASLLLDVSLYISSFRDSLCVFNISQHSDLMGLYLLEWQLTSKVPRQKLSTYLKVWPSLM